MTVSRSARPHEVPARCVRRVSATTQGLVGPGHDVFSAREHCPQASDEALLALAREDGRVLITEDKDFGELVFLRGLPHPGVVRLCGMTPAERVEAMRMLEHHAQAMRDGAIVVVTRERVRIRKST